MYSLARAVAETCTHIPCACLPGTRRPATTRRTLSGEARHSVSALTRDPGRQITTHEPSTRVTFAAQHLLPGGLFASSRLGRRCGANPARPCVRQVTPPFAWAASSAGPTKVAPLPCPTASSPWGPRERHLPNVSLAVDTRTATPARTQKLRKKSASHHAAKSLLAFLR
jgi:hypothetical protein